jgi:hypothetical protein
MCPGDSDEEYTFADVEAARRSGFADGVKVVVVAVLILAAGVTWVRVALVSWVALFGG